MLANDARGPVFICEVTRMCMHACKNNSRQSLAQSRAAIALPTLHSQQPLHFPQLVAKAQVGLQ